jgi:hypothetical protein
MIRKSVFTAIALGFALSPLSAQWVTESHPVKSGWNAIYPFVDASDVTIDTLLASEPRVEEIWRWNPDAQDTVALLSPSAPIIGAEWSKWKRGVPGESTMTRLRANYAYLIKVKSTAEPFSLSIKGKATMPSVSWRNDGLNLVGFPTSQATSPPIASYLAPTDLLSTSTDIFRYIGGTLSTNNPQKLLNPTLQALRRGEALWIDTVKFSDYYGPIKVQVSLSSSGLSFGDTVSMHQVILTNRTASAITVTLTPAGSGKDREGNQPSSVPLLERVLDEDSQDYTYPAFDGPKTLTLQAGQTKAKYVAIDRAELVGVAGTEYASLLVVTDSEGMSRIDLPVSATIGDLGGLWVGEALINRVQNQLQQFQRDADGKYLYENGARIPLAGSADNSLNETAQSFPVRLIVHTDATGTARLLSNVYAGPIATAVEGANPRFGIATHQSLLDAGSLAQSVRLTAVHFPLDLNQAMTGSFGAGGSLAGTVTLDYKDKTNPFIHAFHPDHDNLDARFEKALPAGAESHTVERKLKLDFDAANPGVKPEWGSQLLTGTFTEEITGIHKNSISVEGKFSLRRLSKEEVLHAP